MKESRLIPITIAGVTCFFTAFLLGACFWYFFGSSKLTLNDSDSIVQSGNQNSVDSEVPVPETNANIEPEPIATHEIKRAPAGEIAISAGEVTLGGGIKKLPLKRVSVEPFSISETEVTNEQYAEFIKATGQKSPDGWGKGTFEKGKENEPVVGMTWKEANAYCEWLSKEIGATVRLPTEAEWVRAARGNTDYKFPWGNDWNDKAAPYSKPEGKRKQRRKFARSKVCPKDVHRLVYMKWSEMFGNGQVIWRLMNPVNRFCTKGRNGG